MYPPVRLTPKIKGNIRITVLRSGVNVTKGTNKEKNRILMKGLVIKK